MFLVSTTVFYALANIFKHSRIVVMMNGSIEIGLTRLLQMGLVYPERNNLFRILNDLHDSLNHGHHGIAIAVLSFECAVNFLHWDSSVNQSWSPTSVGSTLPVRRWTLSGQCMCDLSQRASDQHERVPHCGTARARISERPTHSVAALAHWDPASDRRAPLRAPGQHAEAAAATARLPLYFTCRWDACRKF